MSAITEPIILDSTGQAIKNSIDLLSANINRTASNIPYDSNLTIKAAIDGKVSKSGDTMTGNLLIDRGSSGDSNILVGGSTSRGVLRLYHTNGKYINIYPYGLTENRNITLPDKGGTIALTSDITVNTFDLNVDVTANTTATTNVNWGNIDRNKVLYSWVWWSNPTSDSPVAITTYYNGTGVGALNQIVHRWSVTQNVHFKICYIYKA